MKQFVQATLWKPAGINGSLFETSKFHQLLKKILASALFLYVLQPVAKWAVQKE